MQVRRFATPKEFQETAGAWLGREPKRNNLTLSILHRALQSGEEGLGWAVESEAGIELALFQTPPNQVTLSDGSVEGVRMAARSLPRDLPGVVGPSAVADTFSDEWSVVSRRRANLHWEMTFYTVERIEAFRVPGGELRRASLADLGALLPLAIAAAKDMNLPPQEQIPDEVEKRVKRSIAGARQFLWIDDGTICAIAGYAEAFHNGGPRIGIVFTPPEMRGRGYGAAITGSLAQLLLTKGHPWVSLFADKANPQSNRIYQRLGFRPELDYRTWLFHRAEPDHA